MIQGIPNAVLSKDERVSLVSWTPSGRGLRAEELSGGSASSALVKMNLVAVLESLVDLGDGGSASDDRANSRNIGATGGANFPADQRQCGARHRNRLGAARVI